MTDQTLRITVVRPYRTVEELLVAELWAISDRTMILVGAAPHAEGASLQFVLTLNDAQVLMRGEGTVIKHYPARGHRPAGLAVRVNVLDEGGRVLTERANAIRAQGGSTDGIGWSQTPPPPPSTSDSTRTGDSLSPNGSWSTPRSPPLARSASVVPAAQRGPSIRSPDPIPPSTASTSAPSAASLGVTAPTQPPSTTSTSAPSTAGLNVTAPTQPPTSGQVALESEQSLVSTRLLDQSTEEISRLEALQRLRERRK
jgi:hypothetical protein